MHEISELARYVAPVASVGGLAAIVQVMRTLGARRLRRITADSSLSPEQVLAKSAEERDGPPPWASS
jgi:hypothetical protein